VRLQHLGVGLGIGLRSAKLLMSLTTAEERLFDVSV
jgi:hypothetical protein